MIGGRFEEERGCLGQSILLQTRPNLVTYKAGGNSINVQRGLCMISLPVAVRLRES